MSNFRNLKNLLSDDGSVKAIENDLGKGVLDSYYDDLFDLRERIKNQYVFLHEYDLELDDFVFVNSNEIEILSFGNYNIDGSVDKSVIAQNEAEKENMISNGVYDFIPKFSYNEDEEKDLMSKIRIVFNTSSLIIDDIEQLSKEYYDAITNEFDFDPSGNILQLEATI